MSDLVFTTVDDDNNLFLEFWIFDPLTEKYCQEIEKEIVLSEG